MAGHFGGNPYKWDFPANTNNPHIGRYLLARGFIYPWETVLDAACATGYGSKIIALAADTVYGYEVDEGCLEAAKHDMQENTIFRVADLNTCELPDVDVCVSIETMEHLTPEGLTHFLEQIRKHVKRCIIMTVPLGGTSWDYVNEPPSPATEKNDFMSPQDVSKLLTPEDSGWHELTSFKFGYSHFGVYFKDQPRVPEEWVGKIGFAEGQYEK